LSRRRATDFGPSADRAETTSRCTVRSLALTSTATDADPMNAPTRPDFAAAVCSHRDYLVRYATRRLADPAAAEDAVQETLLAALQASDRFERRATLRTWLTGILQRRMADGLRRRYRAPLPESELRSAPGPDDDADDKPTGATAHEAIDWIDPQRRLEGRQLVGRVAEAFGALPPLAARVVALRVFDGLDNDAAARALGLGARRCAGLLSRARARLRAALDGPDLQLREADAVLP
jgi:RNA polymerase sigma-70 factor (ECF subfamily)